MFVEFQQTLGRFTNGLALTSMKRWYVDSKVLHSVLNRQPWGFHFKQFQASCDTLTKKFNPSPVGSRLRLPGSLSPITTEHTL